METITTEHGKTYPVPEWQPNGVYNWTIAECRGWQEKHGSIVADCDGQRWEMNMKYAGVGIMNVTFDPVD